MKKKHRLTWKSYHKWVGLCFAFFVLMFCFSGIVLNHRSLFSRCEVARWWLPKSYHYENWNNGFVKGTLPLSSGELLLYGGAGVWRTDSTFSQFEEMNQGMAVGIDNRKVNALATLPDGSLWSAALFDLYQWEGEAWQVVPLPENEERISDVTARGDTLVVVTRSVLYESLPPYDQFVCHALQTPADYSSEVSLFRTLWLLHSGELFGITGKIVVDLLGIVLILLCLTGIVYFFFPNIIKRRNKAKKPIKSYAKTLNISSKWHVKIGVWSVVLTILLALTGTCLRPPLMIPFVLTKTQPIPGSSLADPNPWHDKLRAIRWDEASGQWLLSTSAGFYSLADFDAVPVAIAGAPYISPMGINVFESVGEGEWLIGSFSGLCRWNVETGGMIDYFSGEPVGRKGGRPVGSVAVAGYSAETAGGPVVFEYYGGATRGSLKPLPAMPEVLKNQPMSLWNFCLELHVGRTYTPFLGVVSELFIFIAGTLLTLILLSGYIIHRRRKRGRKKIS